MSRIQQKTAQAAAQSRKLLIPYIVAGDPDLATSLALMHALVAAGADIIELGFPFSDPSSDGPVIQRGVERALATGTTLAQVLELVTAFRELDALTPVVLMGYLNPIEIMGTGDFVDAAAAAGVDGVLIVDMPVAESGSLAQQLRARDIDTLYLVAPTTRAARIQGITAQTSGYLYYVSLKGVTGAALTDYDSVRANIAALRQQTDLPIVIGFGIKDAASARAMAELADGAVIGSALVAEIEKLARGGASDTEAVQRTVALIAEAREALDAIR